MNKFGTPLFSRAVNIVTVLLLILPIATLHAQEYSSYVDGQKKYYETSNTQVLVKFKNADAQSRCKETPAKFGAKEASPLPILSNVSLLTFETGTTKSNARKFLGQLVNDADVVQASPLLLNNAGEPFGGATNQFIVKLKSNTSLAQLEQLLRKTGTTIDHKYEFDSKTYYISDSRRGSDVMAEANLFYESGLFEYSEPNFLLLIDKDSNDEFYVRQYALDNQGQTGGTTDADMDVVEAWRTFTYGIKKIRVAVLDDGVELGHPDFIQPGYPSHPNALEAGFDATGAGSGGASGPGDAHGTACAGIIGARANNGIGIAGVAPSCSVVPIRIYTGTSSVFDVTTAGWVATGIDWAWQNNRADILSLSWHMRVGQQAISDAINRAVTQGRNGLGCLVFAASGNGNTALDFPASLPNVIAVGSTTHTDQRASTSNFGTGLDIVAPGEGIHTLDLTGTAGYSRTDYVSNFSGTSAACPNAAGVAALVLSINPSLGQARARQILESNTDKTGGYAYAAGAGESPSLTWNNEMGYGRVNALNACREACQELSARGLVIVGQYTQASTGAVSPLYNNSNPVVPPGTYYIDLKPLNAQSYSPIDATINPWSFGDAGGVGAYNLNNNQRGVITLQGSTGCSVNVSAYTICNTTASFYFRLSATSSYSLAASPNPADSELSVEAIPEADSPVEGKTKKPDFKAHLYNSFGVLVKTENSQNGKALLKTLDLPNGLYTLRAGTGADAISKHIQISH